MKLFLSNTFIFALLFSMLVILPLVNLSQSFVDISANLTSISGGSGVWGDYDNDKDLDLLITGETPAGNPITKLYVNQDGSFSDINAGFEGVSNGYAMWVDYNNDGDLDVIITGETSLENAFLYRNDNGIFFEEVNELGYFGDYSHISWGDYDNDGDPDLFLTGNWNSRLYLNEEGIFTPTADEFIMLASGRGYWTDMDNDSDLDLLLTGDTGGGMKLFLYTNENGGFTETELLGMGLSAGSIEPGDYDADGDLDILIMGFNDNVEPQAEIFRNDGNYTFTNIYAGLPPVTLGRATWGDYDNDGDLDVAITGKLSGCGVFMSDIYENEGNDYFNSQNINLQSAELSFISWGDYDNDSDLDLFLCGNSYSNGPFAKVYRNDISSPNFLPEPPQVTFVDFSSNEVILNWEDGTDMQTPVDGLSYNIRIGTEPMSGDVLSPMAHISDGYRKIPSLSNTTQGNSWILKGLEEEMIYYWSVQTIDNSFAASEFSEEQSFTTNFTGIPDKINSRSFDVTPNPATDYILIDIDDLEQVFDFEVLSITGNKLMEFKARHRQKINIQNLDKGIYLLQLKKEDASSCIKLIVN